MPKGEHRWNHGRIPSSHGYTKIRVGKGHPLADGNGYAYEHTVVWVSAGNRLPKPDEVLHHKNENKADNRIKNLELKKRVDHSVGHNNSLSNDDVYELRVLYDEGFADMKGLAERYKIPIARVSRIIRGETRRSAGGPMSNADHRKSKKGKA